MLGMHSSAGTMAGAALPWPSLGAPSYLTQLTATAHPPHVSVQGLHKQLQCGIKGHGLCL